MVDHVARGEDDERLPERAARGNKERPERVPTEGHEGAVRVGDDAWEQHGRRKDTAQALAEDRQPVE